MPVDFMVHEITHTYHRTDKRNRNHKAVKSPKWIPPGGEHREEYHRNHQADCAAVRGKAAIPGVENLHGMLREVIPLIEETMPKASADNSGDNYIYKEHTEPFLGHAFVAEHALHYLVADKEPDHKHHAVPAYGDRPQ